MCIGMTLKDKINISQTCIFIPEIEKNDVQKTLHWLRTARIAAKNIQ